jgi:hypothetical protein
MNAFTRFLGDTPLRVAVKLIVLSFLAGLVMAAFGLSPWDVVEGVRDIVEGLWNMGFDALYRFWGYFLLGAVIVVPLFLILRLLKFRR